MLARAVYLATLAVTAAPAYAQDIPRTAQGRPDFQGVWEARWRTTLERPAEADGPVVAADKADALVAAMNASLRASGNLTPDEDYDFATLMPAPGGGFRTSLIVSPADGKRPLNQAAQDWARIIRDRTDKAEGPEARGLTERCVRGSVGAAPLAPGANQNYRQFIQTAEHVVIWTEAYGDTRIIEMDGRARPDGVVSWLGDSVGRWEGDTLVVETRLLRPEPARPAAPPGVSERRLTERFQLNSRAELDYSYTLEDPAMFTTPLVANFVFIRTDSRMYESACHEGNYGLANILLGARIAEERAAAKRR